LHDKAKQIVVHITAAEPVPQILLIDKATSQGRKDVKRNTLRELSAATQ